MHVPGFSQIMDINLSFIAQTQTTSAVTHTSQQPKSLRLTKYSENNKRVYIHKKVYSTGDSAHQLTTNNNVTINSPINDLVKKIPLNMQIDKEDLYHQVVNLKEQINKANQENATVKAKLVFMQKDYERMQSIISNVGGYLIQGKKTNDPVILTKMGISENLLTVTLKKTIVDLKSQINKKIEENHKLKYSIKYTQIQELNVQIESCQMEGMRLRTLLDQSMRNQAIIQLTNDFNQHEEKFYFQMQVINQLKQENEYQSGLIRMNEESRFGLQVQIQIQEQNQLDAQSKNIKKYQQIIDDLSQTLKDKTHEIDQLSQQIDIQAAQNQILQNKTVMLDNLSQKIKQMIVQEVKFKQERIEKNQNIEYLDKTLTEMRQKLNDKASDDVKQIMFLQDELHKYQLLYEEIEDKYRHMLLIQAHRDALQTIPDKLRQQYTVAINYKKNAAIVTQDSQYNKILELPKKLKVVKLEDVQQIGLDLFKRLQLKKIEIIDVIENHLFNQRNQNNGFITTKDLKACLQIEPFMMKDKKQLLLFARFLIEDNNQEFIEFDLDSQNTLGIVKSIFTKLVRKEQYQKNI